MSRAVALSTVAALSSGAIVDRTLVLFDLGSGLYGFWTGLGPITYAGTVYQGAGSLIEIEAMKQTGDLSAVEIVVRLSSIANTDLSPDLLATIEQEKYHQRPVTIMTAYFDAESYGPLSVETEFRGYIDRVVHMETSDGQAVLEGHLVSRFRDHQRTGYRVRSDTDQRRINPLDDGLRHVTIVATEPILFGRAAQTAAAPLPVPVKKKKFLGLF